MKKTIAILILLILVTNVYAIEKYSKHDILFVILDELVLRIEPNFNSGIVKSFNLGDQVVVQEVKYTNDEDVALSSSEFEWQRILTGRWVKVKSQDKIGYVLDTYLSHHNFLTFKKVDFAILHDTLQVLNYMFYTRTVWPNGMIAERGTGTEWGIETYLIPDFTSEESILFVKKGLIDYTFSKQLWTRNEDEIIMTETDGVSSRKLKITKCGEYSLIEITDWM